MVKWAAASAYFYRHLLLLVAPAASATLVTQSSWRAIWIEKVFSRLLGVIIPWKEIFEYAGMIEIFGPTTPITYPYNGPAKFANHPLATPPPKAMTAIHGRIDTDIKQIIAE